MVLLNYIAQNENKISCIKQQTKRNFRFCISKKCCFELQFLEVLYSYIIAHIYCNEPCRLHSIFRPTSLFDIQIKVLSIIEFQFFITLVKFVTNNY